jgi:hypothetical protein
MLIVYVIVRLKPRIAAEEWSIYSTVNEALSWKTQLTPWPVPRRSTPFLLRYTEVHS